MATPNRLGVSFAANTPVNVVVGGTNGGTYHVNFVNTSTSMVTVSLATSTVTGTLQANGMLLSSETLAAGKSLFYGPIILENSEFVVAESSAVDVVCVGQGMDK